LNEALREELTAINQYFVHAEMCHNWGYHRLGNYIKKQSIGEMKHAEEILERILFLDGIPSIQPLPLTIGSDVKGQLESDLKLELKATVMYNESIKAPPKPATTDRPTCSSAAQGRSARRLPRGADPQIAQLGYERYLGQQLEGSESK
jgi:bacterioferritin